MNIIFCQIISHLVIKNYVTTYVDFGVKLICWIPWVYIKNGRSYKVYLQFFCRKIYDYFHVVHLYVFFHEDVHNIITCTCNQNAQLLPYITKQQLSCNDLKYIIFKPPVILSLLYSAKSFDLWSHIFIEKYVTTTCIYTIMLMKVMKNWKIVKHA